MESFDQGREAVSSPWLLNEEQARGDKTREAGTLPVRLVEGPIRGKGAWPKVVAVQEERRTVWRSSGVRKGAQCV